MPRNPIHLRRNKRIFSGFRFNSGNGNKSAQISDNRIEWSVTAMRGRKHGKSKANSQIKEKSEVVYADRSCGWDCGDDNPVIKSNGDFTLEISFVET